MVECYVTVGSKSQNFAVISTTGSERKMDKTTWLQNTLIYNAANVLVTTEYKFYTWRR